MNNRIIATTLSLVVALSVSVGCSGSNNAAKASSKPAAAAASTVSYYNNWQTYSIKGMGEFQVPPTMELQSQNYRTATKNVVDKAGYGDKSTDRMYKEALEGSRIVFQQRGLNAAMSEFQQKGPGNIGQASRDAMAKYSRVVFRIEDAPGVPKLGDKLDFSKADLDEYTKAITQENSNSPIMPKVISCRPAVVENINGIECIHIEYLTQLKTNPPTQNHTYIFFNKNKTYTIVIMYRTSQLDVWNGQGQDLRDVVKTIKFY